MAMAIAFFWVLFRLALLDSASWGSQHRAVAAPLLLRRLQPFFLVRFRTSSEVFGRVLHGGRDAMGMSFC